MTGGRRCRLQQLATLSMCTLLSVACHQRNDESALPAATPAGGSVPALADSARGTLLLIGNEPVARLLLSRGDRSSEPLALTGALLPALRRVVGLDVVLFGHLTGARAPEASPRGAALFDVTSLLVRSADGVAAHDGIVEFRSSKWWLRLVDGRELAVALMPALLRQQIGARVWIAGPLDVAPVSYGLIIPAR